MTDDRALVSRIISGDMQAFRLLIKQNERLVTHMIARLVDRAEDREEICQDVFMKAYEKLAEFNFQSRLSTWVATIAYRHAINHLRKRRIEVADLPEEGEMERFFVADDNPGQVLAERELEAQLLQLIEQLPVQYKTVLTLFHLDDKNYAEIGEITGMPEGTVKSYLFRARALLKEKAKKYLNEEEWI
jgi:RNA polymerase sigma-70 factor (ECF subfamily)